jgi:pimeloyl-ACP methyl ester carboxylesterase
MEPSFVTVQGRRLEYRRIASSRPALPTLVFLHEGLGSVSTWRDFPDRVAAATGCGALVYSRYGYGRSDVLERAHRVDYMHREALDFLPEVLEKLGIDDPLPVGHSDGGSIALIYAGARHPAKAVVLLAPHVFVEDISVESIAKAKRAFETTDMRKKLARHHADPTKTFYGWNDIWLHPDFRAWNIEAFLPDVRLPILAVQGEDDEYGTMRQIDAIAAQAGGPVELVRLAECGHSPHRDQPEATLAAIGRFVGALPPR